jgi:hypothetical protein
MASDPLWSRGTGTIRVVSHADRLVVTRYSRHSNLKQINDLLYLSVLSSCKIKSFHLSTKVYLDIDGRIGTHNAFLQL